MRLGAEGSILGHSGALLDRYAAPMARLEIPPGRGDDYLRLGALSPTVARAAGTFSMAVYASADIPVRLRELMRIRVARINHCVL